MKDFKTLCILGRLPQLGTAELESLYGAEHLKAVTGAALLDIPAEEIDFKRLGGTIKTARILSVLPSTDWPAALAYLKKAIPGHLADIEGKLTLGISVYGLSLRVEQLNRDLLGLKKTIKNTGRPVRVVPNKTLELNSAQVLHNKLTHKGGWELLVFLAGKETIIAQTLFVQDIEAYAARDQARPKRDARIGMLPPKLAQTLVNLAAGPLKKQPEEAARIRVLDPFCGTGVVLQEALLMGYSVLGTDIEARMVEYTQENLRWLIERNPKIEGQAAIETADATSYQWPRFSFMASEVFLGRPLTALPPTDRLKEIINDANTITKKFLKNLAPQLREGQRLALAVPAWQKPDGSFIRLPVIDQLTDMGYTYLDLKHVRREDLIYYRSDQVVARQILILEKS